MRKREVTIQAAPGETLSLHLDTSALDSVDALAFEALRVAMEQAAPLEREQGIQMRCEQVKMAVELANRLGHTLVILPAGTQPSHQTLLQSRAEMLAGGRIVSRTEAGTWEAVPEAHFFITSDRLSPAGPHNLEEPAGDIEGDVYRILFPLQKR